MSQDRIQFELIRLLERAGNAFGLSASAINFARYCLCHTQDVDWQPGNSAIIYKSVGVIAKEINLSERQVYNLERTLCEKLGLTIRATANSRRYGQRESTDEKYGKIIFAYGLDLTPLKEKIQSLREALVRIEAERAEWSKIKRQIGQQKRTIRTLLSVLEDIGEPDAANMFRAQSQELAKRIPASTELAVLKARLALAWQIKGQLEQAIIAAHAVNISDRSAKNFRHKEYPTDNLTDINLSVSKGSAESAALPESAEPDKFDRFATTSNASLSAPEAVKADISVRFSSGAEHVSVRAAWKAASDRFRSLMGEDANEAALISAAKDSLRRLGISGFQWEEACGIIGDYAAALCVLLIERKQRKGQIQASAAYFQGMVRRSLLGRLALEKSIFRLIWAEEA